MPKRTDIHSVLVIGSGPIIIGQAAEFDYSGTQACRVLRAEGLQADEANAFSVQHHPEAGPGPHDSQYLFGRFVEQMGRYRDLATFTVGAMSGYEPTGLPASDWGVD